MYKPKLPVTFPNESPTSALPETARRFIEAAEELLRSRGFPALTLNNVAQAAGRNKAQIIYHFGSKDGLLAALVDCTIHDASIELAQRTEGIAESEERMRLVSEGIETMARDAESFALFFEVLPHALRDPELRSRHKDLYAWYRDLYCQILRGDGIDSDESSGLAALLAAVLDGLAIQYSLARDTFDIAGACRELDHLLTLRSGAGPPRD